MTYLLHQTQFFRIETNLIFSLLKFASGSKTSKSPWAHLCNIPPNPDVNIFLVRFQLIRLLDTQSENVLICMNILPTHETILPSSSSTAHNLHSGSCCSMKCISSRSLGNIEYRISRNFQWKLTHRPLVDSNPILQFRPDLDSCWQQPISFG